ncbi:MAG: GNAT family N-acetyltransferase [Rhizobiales bacterium]|nr:GNAT family N-acetyltransferase [Hyphomicrobiales bacterium]
MHNAHIPDHTASAIDTGHVDITTDRLRLQPLKHEHKEAAVALLAEKDIAKCLANMPSPYSEADFDEFIQIVHAEDNKDLVLAITNWQDGAFLGVVSLQATQSPDVVELGYWLGKPYWGIGIMKEATMALIDQHFAVSEKSMIRAGYFTDNPASGNVLRFLGFRDINEQKVYSLARKMEVDHRDMELTREAYLGTEQKPDAGRQRDLARSTSYSMNY